MDASARRAAEDTLEGAIAAWTIERPAEAAMNALLKAGVAAGVARRPFTLDKDPHLTARGFWRRADRAFIGPHWQSSPAFREGRDPSPLRHLAPTLGQHNAEILGGLLGLDAAALERLAVLEVTGTVPKPRRPQGDA